MTDEIPDQIKVRLEIKQNGESVALGYTRPLDDLARDNPSEYARQIAEVVERTVATQLQVVPVMEVVPE